MIRKILLYTALGFFLLSLAGGAVVLTNQDRIIAFFVQQVNQRLKTEVRIGKISLSLFEKFPQLAIKLDRVRITGTRKGDARPMATAEKLYGTLDLRDLWSGRYVVNQIYLENAAVLLATDAKGNPNFDILQRNDRPAGESAEESAFDLKRILLKNVNVRYERDGPSKEVYEAVAHDAVARFGTRGGEMDIGLDGSFTTRQLRLGKQNYFRDKRLTLHSQLHYRPAQRELTVQPSTLTINEARFTLQGRWRDAEPTDRRSNLSSQVDLQIRSDQTDVQTLLSLLPEATARKLGNYRSQGDLFFNATVKGDLGRRAFPRVEVRFGCQNATFVHPGSGKRVKNVFLAGTYSNGRSQSAVTSSLSLKNLRGSLDGRGFGGNFTVNNFLNPTLAFNLRGSAEAGSLLAFYPVENLERAKGELAWQISFEGKTSDLKTDRLAQYVRTSGELTVRDLQFKLRGVDLAFDRFNGNFQFRKSDLRIRGFSGRAGSSDFRLDGYFKNIVAYLLIKGQDLGVEADFASHLLNFDELLTTRSSNPKAAEQHSAGRHSAGRHSAGRHSAEPYRFDLSPRLSLNLNCRVDQLRFRRFRARNARGQVVMRDQVARLSDLALQMAGGTVALEATVDGRQNNRLAVQTQARLERIAVDSAFYTFENFGQTFIQDRHLKGQLSSRIRASLVFNDRLDLLAPLAKADLETSVLDGELNQFSPMQKLSFFLRRRELANIRFSELKNSLHIENRTVTIPEMEIRSNVSNIAVFGTHTFDQVMDYHLRFPLSNLARPDKDEKFGPVADESGGGNVFLTLRGTSDNFKVGYDVKRVASKIKGDLRNAEWKNPFRKKPASTKAEAETEYFDFH
ncbi:MAG: hypothetical protein H7Z75_07975 [Ferruginibacter sp.]|nr:hypothetical protein [Cytophagales bacterium]